MNSPGVADRWSRFAQAPLVLRVYIVFVLVASVVGASVLFAPTLNAAIVPYTGWIGFFNYSFTLYFALQAILIPYRKLTYAVIALLGWIMFLGIFDTYQHTLGPNAGREDFRNPYLTYQSFRPVFTVALPALWITMFISPPMRRWMRGTSEAEN